MSSTIETDRGLRWMSGASNDALLDVSVKLSSGRKADTMTIDLRDRDLSIDTAVPEPVRGQQMKVDCFMLGGAFKAFSGFLVGKRFDMARRVLSLDFQDRASGMRHVERSTNLTNTSALAVLELVAERNGLELDASSADTDRLDQISFRSVLWHGETDWDVVDRIARGAGHTASERDGVLIVREQWRVDEGSNLPVLIPSDFTSGPVITVKERRRDTTPQIVGLDGEDVGYGSDGEPVTRDVRLYRTGLSTAAVNTPQIASQALEREISAQARARRERDLSGSLRGIWHRLAPDEPVLLSSAGQYSGIWMVDDITFSDSSKGLSTKVTMYNGGTQ
jgi:hypothetical protein